MFELHEYPVFCDDLYQLYLDARDFSNAKRASVNEQASIAALQHSSDASYDALQAAQQSQVAAAQARAEMRNRNAQRRKTLSLSPPPQVQRMQPRPLVVAKEANPQLIERLHELEKKLAELSTENAALKKENAAHEKVRLSLVSKLAVKNETSTTEIENSLPDYEELVDPDS
ncbi:hypothetical protein CYMTET_9343 [Cymbomonas tetramitiformis]|uniref:Uncharacterized protein n=1 Tax=Cymbomonas tetramitiformis TaxID=36881 RepID=A0AAE0GSZ7_9CHLO|nr:hypothetical protein CYMTET_9343 [Cymbomonas tetramitiformis]